ncbi:LysM peptidoglycan-binding domain-containing protein [Lactobacillus amylovorus]|uniref:LysM peptidoglycan-binding domain-containing protein n=1 Tax=Lactobacillus amylovorus TaxID=1604 RepID=UPI00232B3A34|nr:LysM domain-containing protein [Lactobacillus amylovorus]MDB6229130.1 LysM domain-containing protein [Lactobacillus amylovorus]
MINLTIINCTPNATSPGIEVAGTWVYKAELENDIEVLAYDFFGYYTNDGYQLSLVDTEYVAQLGDSWYSISRRHGIPVTDLLVLNRAAETDKIFAGQVIRIA